ncbi:MAG: pyruvate dehydrogenase (acetyl-transferring), homodimeric type, partial [Candidatus Blochmannia sp. A2]|nr:pyruvate dehydrogenase (acetyl-transferring), homodimeric type [Candidatus Blochmannia sp. A2]
SLPTTIYHVLGTDGFGRSDSRDNLRNHFEVSTYYIVIAALSVLFKSNSISSKVVEDAIIRFNIDVDKINPRLA